MDSLFRLQGPPRDEEDSPDVVEVCQATLQRIAAWLQHSGVWSTPTVQCITGSYSGHPIAAKIVREFTRALQDAGVGMLLASDDGWTVHEELADAGQRGADAVPSVAHRHVQRGAVLRQTGRGRDGGGGKRADMVLLSGNPLADVRYAQEPAGVMINGLWLDRAELDRRLLAATYLRFWSNTRPRYSWLVVTAGGRS